MPRLKLSKEEKAARNAARQAAWRANAEKKGLTRITVAIEQDTVAALKRLAVQPLTLNEVVNKLLLTGLRAALAEDSLPDKALSVTDLTALSQSDKSSNGAGLEPIEPLLEPTPPAAPKKPHYPPELKARAVAMHQRGDSFETISAMLVRECGRAPDRSNWARDMKHWAKALGL